MREKFIKYAEHMEYDDATPEMIKDLKEIFCQNGMFHEEGACLEKLFHITHEPELYKEIGEIFQYKLSNYEVANAAYNRYLYNTDKEFFKNYAKNINNLGYRHISEDNMEDNEPYELILLCDRFDFLVYMIICLSQNNAYDEIIKLREYMLNIKQQILDYKFYIEQDSRFMDSIESSEKHLSEILSEIKNRNDINRFAMALNPLNKRAYINILDDFITYKNYEEAIKFYNDEFAVKFERPNKTSIPEICWEISDFYRDNYEFYMAVKFQKLSLEIDLGVRC